MSFQDKGVPPPVHITWDVFAQWGDDLVNTSARFEGRPWMWVYMDIEVAQEFCGHGGRYLCKRERGSRSRTNHISPHLTIKTTEDTEDDVAVLEADPSLQGMQEAMSVHTLEPRDKELDNEDIDWEYHIVYSPTYHVPVMLVNATSSDGSGLTMEDIYTLIPTTIHNPGDLDASAGRGVLAARWSFVTQVPHPMLGIPFFEVHPCETPHVLATIAREREEEEEDGHGNGDMYMYLLYWWLSLYSQAVGLHVPLSLFAAVHTTGGHRSSAATLT